GHGRAGGDPHADRAPGASGRAGPRFGTGQAGRAATAEAGRAGTRPQQQEGLGPAVAFGTDSRRPGAPRDSRGAQRFESAASATSNAARAPSASAGATVIMS